jgi:hypothetical protein
MSLSDNIQKITGKKPTSEQTQRIIEIAESCNISTDDPLFPLFVTQEIYHQTYLKMPARFEQINRELEQAAKYAAEHAATASTRLVNEAIAHSIPELAKASSAAAARAVTNVEFGRSAFSVCAAAVVNFICVFFGVVMTLTWQNGAANFQHQSGSVFIFSSLSAVFVACSFFYFIRIDKYGERGTFQNVCGFFAVITFVLIAALIAMMYL